MNIEIVSNQQNDIERIVRHLQQDGLIGLPTETVYGLGARADHPEAVLKIFQLKGRPTNHPLIIHLAPAKKNTPEDWLDVLTPWVKEIPNEAIVLAQAFWPGPLTMIFKKSKAVIHEVTGGNETVAIRCPNHPEAIAILQSLGTGIAAPSANRYGKISPTTAQHVFEEFIPVAKNFNNAFDLLISDAGNCDVGIESTIIDLSRMDSLGLSILRPGIITGEDICSKTGLTIGRIEDGKVAHSGSHIAHYAPSTPLQIIDYPLQAMKLPKGEKSVWLSSMEEDWSMTTSTEVLALPTSPKEFAKKIYGLLRELDKRSLDKIYLRALPNNTDWEAIRDRLQRAATGSVQSSA